MIRGWQTSTLILKKGVLSGADIGRLREFCDERGFDPAWFPGIDPGEVNRRNRVPRPWLHEAAVALLRRDHERFLADYKFHIGPATDDRPYFFHFFRWGLLPELIALRGQGGLTLLDTGYLVLVGTLALALPLSLLLVLVPLATLGRRPRQPVARATWHLLPVPGPRLSVRRDRLHAALWPVRRPSACSPPCPCWWVS